MKRFLAVFLIVVFLVMLYMVPVAHAEFLSMGAIAGICSVLALAGVEFTVWQGGQGGLFSAVQKLLQDLVDLGVYAYNSVSDLVSAWSAGFSFSGNKVYVTDDVYNEIKDGVTSLEIEGIIQDNTSQLIYSDLAFEDLNLSTFNNWKGTFGYYLASEINFGDVYTVPVPLGTFTDYFTFSNGVKIRATRSRDNIVQVTMIYRDAENIGRMAYLYQGTSCDKFSFALYNDSLYLLRYSSYWWVTEISVANQLILTDDLTLTNDRVTADYVSSRAQVLYPTVADSVAISVPTSIGLTTQESVIDAALAGDLAVTGELVATADIPVPSIPSYDGGDYAVSGLTEVFPFCIPFDIYRFLSVMAAERETPRFTIPLNFGERVGDYSITIDLTEFNGVASVLRTLELLGFCVGLAIFTRRYLMGGG